MNPLPQTSSASRTLPNRNRLKGRNMNTKTRHLTTAGLLALGAFAALPAGAAILNWNGSAGSTWDNTSLNWKNGSTAVVWGGDVAQFTSAGVGAVTVGDTVNANQVIFSFNGYTLNSGTINLTGPAVIGISGGGGFTETIGSVLSGNAGLNVQGSQNGILGVVNLSGANTFTGNLTLVGAALNVRNTNSYTGTTTVTGGSALKIDFSQGAASTSNLINASSPLVLADNSTLTVTGSAGLNNSQAFGGLTLNPGAAAAAATIGTGGKVLVNLGGITRNAGGTLNLTQPSGTISGTNGFVTASANDTYGLISGLTVGGSDWATNTGTNIVALAAGSYTASHNVATWAANQNITNTAAYTGTLDSDLTIGSLRFNKAAASTVNLGGSTLTAADGILVTTTVAGYASAITGGTLKGASGKDLVVIQNNTNAAGTLTISSNIVDNGGATALTKSGLGILTLSGSNSYSGGTFVNTGTLNINSNNAIGTGALTLFNGATIDNTSGTAVTLPGSNTVILGTPGTQSTVTYLGSNSGTLSIGAAGITIPITQGASFNAQNSFNMTVSSGTLNLAGNISPAAGSTAANYNYMMTKYGNGTLALSGSNYFFAKILVRGGTIAINHPYALGGAVGAGLNIASGTYVSAIDNTSGAFVTLTSNPALSIANNLTFFGSQSLDYGMGAVTLAATPTLAIVSNTLTLGGIVSGNFGIIKTGTGTLALAGINTYTGATAINGGALLFSGSTSLGAATAPVSFDGGALKWATGNTANISNRTVTFNAGGATFDTNGNNVTFANAIGNSGVGGLTKAGAGILTLNGANSYTGSTLVSTGTLKLASGATLANSTAIDVASGATFDASAAPLTVGAGKALVNNGTFTGNLTINGTLSGYGRVSGTVSGSGLVSPGNSPGILTVNQTDPTGHLGYAFEFTGTGSPLYTTATASRNDVLRITNTTTPFSSALIASNTVSVYFNVASLTNTDLFKGGFYTDAGSDFQALIKDAKFDYYIKGGTHTFNGVNYYTLAEYNTTNSSAFSVTVSTLTETANFGGGPVNGYVTQFAVPEPSALALFALGGLALLRRRRAV